MTVNAVAPGFIVGVIAVAEFLLDYDTGFVLAWDSFSTTRNADQAFFGNVLFIIEAKNARWVGDFSATPKLEEAIFPPGTRFRVVAVERKGDDAVIELEEV